MFSHVHVYLFKRSPKLQVFNPRNFISTVSKFALIFGTSDFLFQSSSRDMIDGRFHFFLLPNNKTYEEILSTCNVINRTRPNGLLMFV